MKDQFRKYLTMVGIFLCGVFPCSASTIYVSVEGCDTGDGSVDSPLRTLARAAAVAQPGDTVLIGEGTYRETLRPARSGKPGAPITFQAARGAKPVITGCDLIEEWKRDRNGRWKATVEWDLGHGLNQLFLNGQPLTEARYPNKVSKGVMEHDLVALRFPEKGVASAAAFDTNRKDAWAGAYFFGHGYEAWAFQCARIAESEGDRLVFDAKTQSNPWFENPLAWGDPKRLAAGCGGGFLFGLPSFLDAPGEWFWQGNEVWLLPPTSAKRSSLKVEARRRSRVVSVENKSRIVLRGLRFVGGALSIEGDHNVLEDCEGLYLTHFMTYTNGYDIGGGTLDGVGLEVTGTGNIIRGCTIAKTAGSGIGMNGKENLVTRCLVEETDYAGTYGACINLRGEKHRILFNTLRKTGRDCLQIQVSGTQRAGGHRVLLNDISLPGMVCHDVGITYFFGFNGQAEDGSDTRLAYNWVHDNPHPTPAPGIYVDNYVRNVQIDHNVVWNVNADASIRINAPTDNTRIFNNTVFHSRPIGSLTYNAFPRYNPDPTFWNDKDHYHLILSNNLDLEANPEAMLVNPQAKDFRLKPGSAAIGAGDVVEGNGNGKKKPDLGAYQMDQPVWVPGHKGRADESLLVGENLEGVTL